MAVVTACLPIALAWPNLPGARRYLRGALLEGNTPWWFLSFPALSFLLFLAVVHFALREARTFEERADKKTAIAKRNAASMALGLAVGNLALLGFLCLLMFGW